MSYDDNKQFYLDFSSKRKIDGYLLGAHNIPNKYM